MNHYRRSDFLVKPRELSGEAALCQVHNQHPLPYGVKVKYLKPAHHNAQGEMLYHESELKVLRFNRANKFLNFGTDLAAAEREIVNSYGR